MDTLKNKVYNSFSYKSRYETVPAYYDTISGREIYGIGSNLIKTTDCFAHQVTVNDSWDSLALKYYNNPTFWWVIAYFNDVQDAFIKPIQRFNIIKIPTITGIEFGATN